MENYRETNLKDLIITVPNNFNKEPFAIVFGGIKYATPSWMKKQVSNELLKSKPFVFVPWNQSIGYIKDSIRNIKISSVSGFSKGGLMAYPALSDGYSFVGLIDPSIEGNYTKVSIPQNPNAVLIYEKGRTWGKKGLDYAISQLQKSGNKEIYPVVASHENIPKLFFQRFGNRL